MKKTKISVVTVCFNASDFIEKTILSVIEQNYSNIEYIIIDGGSKDGTINIIKKYTDHISYWLSEPDKGIYDAMNKGIKVATGEWINFMNAGDTFCDNNVISEVFSISNKHIQSDIIYGDSISKDKYGSQQLKISDSKIEKLKYAPIYRHGASFVRTSLHKQYLFDLSKKKFGYALDYYCIYTLYCCGYRFERVDCKILSYLNDGVSNHPYKNLYYNFLIASSNGISIKILLYEFYALIKLIYQNVLSAIRKSNH